MSRNIQYDEALEELSDKLQKIDFLFWFGQNISEEEVKNSATALTKRMLMTYESKDTDYSENDLPMGNFRESTELGVEPWIGIMLRIGDKKRRIGSFVQRSSYLVADENVDDTLVDSANYALLCKVLFDEWSERQEANGSKLTSSLYKLSKDFMSIAFINLAFYAILSKMLYEFKNTEGVSSWNDKSWEKFNKTYSAIAQFAKSLTSIL